MLNLLTTYFAAPCAGGGFLGFQTTWYTYLNGVTINGLCSPTISKLTDVWLIVAAVIEILLHIAGLVAVAFVIVGAMSYVMSQGKPESTAKARDTIVNALIGLAIAVTSAAIVAFIAKSIT